MKSKFVLVLVVAIVTGACGCGSGSGSSHLINLTLAITRISPTSAPAGGAAFVLTVQGTKFVPGSVINFGNMPITAAYSCLKNIDPSCVGVATLLSAAIPAVAITTPGAVLVTVTNPAGGGTSNAVNFTVASGPYPEANITSIGPTGAVAGSPGFTLDLGVSNFLAGSVVRWNGSDRSTTVAPNFGGNCCWEVEAQIPASDIAAPGTAAITIFNPVPGAGSSNAVTFTIAAHGVYPDSVAVHPAGTFAYVTNLGSDNVSTYAINTDGTLTFKATIAAGTRPGSIAVHRSGKFAYVGNFGNGSVPGSVSMYTIDTTTGALMPNGDITNDVSDAVAVDPSGRFVYVGNSGGVSMYSIDATTGKLTSIGTVAAGGGGGVSSLAVHPSGKFVYATAGGGFKLSPGLVSVYTLNATTGVLASNGTAPTELYPISIAIAPSGKFAYVTNYDSHSISMYTIDAVTGTLTLIGTIVT